MKVNKPQAKYWNKILDLIKLFLENNKGTGLHLCSVARKQRNDFLLFLVANFKLTNSKWNFLIK